MGAADETFVSETGVTARIGPGTQLGKYRMVRLLGQGAMGQVWSAHDPDLERHVALKLIKSDNAAPQLRTRLLREARAMARLKHPNVLTVYEVGSEGDRDYIVMELVEGTNVDQWLATSPPADQVWSALFAAGRGLAAAHRAGLVHRDFKPHNVLRSNDGRVLVTDFGLARGVGDELLQTLPQLPTGEVGLATTLDASSKDSLLDSPLTQTGAVIGTPAYMAPEQYIGSPPDPRTDQFAFCVTAWQALTGERPFKGTTIDELRRETSRGVAGIKTRLPRRVRAVLARGLDPDPARRWDDLDALLAALERARHGRRLWPLVFPAFALAAAGVLFVSMTRRHEVVKPASPYACEEPEKAFYNGWNEDDRARLQKRAGVSAELAIGALDDFRRDWLAAYAKACAAPPGPLAFARLGCLLAERDDAVTILGVIGSLPVSALDQLDITGMVARVDACEGESPVTPPLLPASGKTRFTIAAVRAEAMMLRLDAPQKLVDEQARFERAAKAPGWDRLVPEVDLEIGRAAERIGRYDDARKHLERAAERAEQLHDYELEANARLALLQTESEASADPADPERETRLAEDARNAVHRAGDDFELGPAIEIAVAGNRVARAAVVDPRSLAEIDPWTIRTNTPRLVVAYTALRMRLFMARQELEKAYALGKTHESQEVQGGPIHAQIENDMVELEWRVGKLEDVHRRADARSHLSVPRDPVRVTGVVEDLRGAPVAHARVVAWLGTLEGDATRLFTRPQGTAAETTTDATGHFSLDAPRGGAVMAEHEETRSAIVDVPDGKPLPALVVAPTHTLTGKVASAAPVPPIDAFVRLRAGKNEWRDRTPVARDGAYQLAGVPRDAHELGLAGRGHTITGAAAGATTWPTGATLDVIGKQPGGVWVFRGHRTIRFDGEAPDLTGGDVARQDTGPIGFASQTTEGMRVYKRDDVHALLQDLAPGDVTVCLDVTRACSPVTVPAHGVLAVSLP